MTVACAHGHASSTADYCDVCGAPLDAAPPEDPTTTPQPIAPSIPPCARCGAALARGERFCEACGHDVTAPFEPGAATARWVAVITVDREQFERCAPDSLEFPAERAELELELGAASVRIGRRRGAGLELELDDPAASQEHATLVRQADGSYAVVDLGSTNGTVVDGRSGPIAAQTPVPLDDGACIRIGAWTVITIRRKE